MTNPFFVTLLPLMLLAGVCLAVAPPEPLLPIPTPQQLKWQDRETTMFVHFTVNTFTDREWGEGTEDPKIFNPAKLDADQWAKAAKAGGFKMMILTAKHHDGFCLWPSRYTDHSVKSSPWRNGKGDLVRKFVNACRKEGLEVGLYLSPWDRHEKSYGDSPRYNDYYKSQLTELLTSYGPIAEVWFDGANGEGPNGKRQEYDWPGFFGLVHKLQPDAVIFSDAGPGVRWIGNESGVAGETNWAMMDPAHVQYPGDTPENYQQVLQHGYEDGTVWRPGETDVSIRPGWFWHAAEDDKVRSVDNLVDLYFQSVGRNSLLLLNVPPTNEGLFHPTDVARLKGFRERLNALFKTDLTKGKPCTASNTRGNDSRYGPHKALDGRKDTYWATDDGVTSGWLEVDLGHPSEIGIAGMEEQIALGQRVKAYHIEVLDGSEWKTVDKGTTIGHKKLDRFGPVTAQKVRLVIDDARACTTIQSFHLYRGN
jgi:alpha-L-fucosidase